MRNWVTETDIAAVAVVVLACGLVVLKHFTGRRKSRFAAISSPLIKPPSYRAMFVVVLIGVLLISTLPEAAYVLPTLDALGLDVVTFLAVLELRHYLGAFARSVRIPSGVAVYVTNPALWLYACMWPLLWVRTHPH
jgi:hypothetical protein